MRNSRYKRIPVIMRTGSDAALIPGVPQRPRLPEPLRAWIACLPHNLDEVFR